MPGNRGQITGDKIACVTGLFVEFRTPTTHLSIGRILGGLCGSAAQRKDRSLWSRLRCARICSFRGENLVDTRLAQRRHECRRGTQECVRHIGGYSAPLRRNARRSMPSAWHFL